MDIKQPLLERLRTLSEEQLYKELYCDPLTGLLNRRALELQNESVFGLVDFDSLKYINDTLGYRSGDRTLCDFAKDFAGFFGFQNVYRLGGDEFVVCSDQPGELRSRLSCVQNAYGFFSFGVGMTLGAADRELKIDKVRRELSGKRAKRGEPPVWLEKEPLRSGSRK